MPITLTRDLATRSSWDAANRVMRAGGRKAWSEEDAEIARVEFLRLWPLCPHLIGPEDFCGLCGDELIPTGAAISGR